MKKLVFVGVLTIVCSIFLSINYKNSDNDGEDLNHTISYNNLKASLDYDKPGYGKSDYGEYDIAHIPKAYAMFLSAELMKYFQSDRKYDISMALNAGKWLLNNADLNKNGIYGWGVPIAWDAFGDDSVNEKNSEYTIATGIVINSLLDWIELSPDTAPKKKIIKTIEKSILPYIENDISRSSSGLYNYSLKESDRKYNCFNAAIYLAGQMQRFTKFISDMELKSRIINSVDRVILATIKYKKIDPNGGWYWSYSIEEDDNPNDLAHAGYIIDGLLTYIANNGTLKKSLDRKLILKHFDYFSSKNGRKWYLRPSFFSKSSPRLYGLGMSLHILSKYIKNNEKISNLIKFISKYKKGSLYTRWQKEDIVITEYLIYLMYGLSSVDFEKKAQETIFLHSDENHLRKVDKLYQKFENDKKTFIALTDFKYKNIDVKFSKKNLYTTLFIDKKELKFDKFKSIPIKIMDNKDSYFVLFRELITNYLLVAKINKRDYTFNFKKIDSYIDSFLDFRNSVILNNELVLIAYESKKSQNTLISYDINNNFKKNREIKLPSLEDPAGHTYEVIPNIFILKNDTDDVLHILGGRTYIEYKNSRIYKNSVPFEVEVVTDALIEKNQIYVIYKSKGGKYNVYNLTENKKHFIADNFEIIYGLDYSKNGIDFKVLKTPDGLKEMFINDFLNNKGSGTLYLGTNNLEGWSAWAQIYYLNGFLSFLELAKNDIEFYEVFEDYIFLIKTRLDLEMSLLAYQYKSKDGFGCRVFSIDRSLSVFAVQSSRFAMLLDRYLKLFDNENIKIIYEELKNDVISLNNHMEVLERGVSNVVSKKWNEFDAYYLKWPKGNKFYFDGLPVPYNHQNEWASFLLQTTDDEKKIGRSIITLFLNHITDNFNNESLPKNAIWPYWWGKAWDGWLPHEDISKNKKMYLGDKENGWISFRSIDSIAILKLYKFSKNKKLENYKNDIFEFIVNGSLYPYLSYEFLDSKQVPLLKRDVISRYIRFTSPWELDNLIWAYFSFIKSN